MPDEVLNTEEAKDNVKSLCFEGPWAWLILIVICVLAFLLAMYLLRKCIEGPMYRKATRLDGKVIIVTGCNTGIGKQTAMELARRGGKIYMACRDAARCEAARLEIIEKTHNQQIYNRTLDLGSLASVRQFAERFHAEEQRLDILVNNAGIMATPRKLTADGFEQQFGVNHLGHFLLTNLLLDRLKTSTPSRIINVSSLAYIFGRINRNDLMGEKHYSKVGAYSQSKLANILFTRKLAELLKDTGVTANACHPGVVRTELFRHNTLPTWCWNPARCLLRYFMKSPVAGAQTSIRLALDPNLEKSSGGFYMDSMRWFLLPNATNKENTDWLWKESEKLVGLSSNDATEVVVISS